MHDELMQLSAVTKYPMDAFIFVQRGLDHTVKRVHGESKPSAEPISRHVSGQQLCQGLREYALEQYGLLARTVLARWRIVNSEDFGHIVFALVDAGLMQKTAEDSIEDFTGVYEFSEAFRHSVQLGDPR